MNSYFRAFKELKWWKRLGGGNTLQWLPKVACIIEWTGEAKKEMSRNIDLDLDLDLD